MFDPCWLVAPLLYVLRKPLAVLLKFVKLITPDAGTAAARFVDVLFPALALIFEPPR